MSTFTPEKYCCGCGETEVTFTTEPKFSLLCHCWECREGVSAVGATAAEMIVLY